MANLNFSWTPSDADSFQIQLSDGLAWGDSLNVPGGTYAATVSDVQPGVGLWRVVAFKGGAAQISNEVSVLVLPPLILGVTVVY